MVKEFYTPISKIRDVTHPIRALIRNHSFEEELTGWIVSSGNVVIDDTDKAYGLKCVKFIGAGAVEQVFPIPIGVDWLDELHLWSRADVIGTTDLKVSYAYSDGTSSTEDVATGTSWNRRVLNPTAGKKIVRITIANTNANRTVKVDDLTTVF